MNIKSRFFSSLLLVSLSLWAWASPPPNLYEAKKALIQYHDSGDYQRQQAQVAKDAQTYLAQRIAENKQTGNKKKLAMVLDIDETSLSGYHYFLAENFGFTIKSFNAYIRQAKEPAIQSTLHLYNYAKAHNVAVFFITGRREKLRQATVKNLLFAGYKNWNGLVLKPSDYNKHSAIPYKSAARKAIEQKGYDIVITMGDQESDLKGGFADKGFKLPNPFYYIP